jgi:hypothetical protein
MAWKDFLGPTDDNGRTQLTDFRVLVRRQHDWLILPTNRQRAAQGLALYAAQRLPARVAKSCLAIGLQLYLPTRKRTIAISAGAPFPRFLAGLAETSPSMPEVGVLAGNRDVEGARYVFLVFDRFGNPCAVAKAGRGEKAHALIRHESDFLEKNSGSLPGLPRFLGRMESGDITAFATAFVAGKSPPANPPDGMGRFLSSWVQEREEIPLHSLQAWRRLEAVGAGDELVGQLSAIRERRVRPVVWHGDFAPWNIKVDSANTWIAVDCERSERRGVPGWNWLHYVVQSGILIERLSPQSLVKRIETQLESESFRHYAHITGINGIEHEILLSYLLYLLRVLKPVKGAAEIQKLLAIISTR